MKNLPAVDDLDHSPNSDLWLGLGNLITCTYVTDMKRAKTTIIDQPVLTPSVSNTEGWSVALPS